MLEKHFRSKTFNSVQASELLRDGYLDKYFKGTYVEWGTRWYMDKLSLRTATNAKLRIQKDSTLIGRIVKQ